MFAFTFPNQHIFTLCTCSLSCLLAFSPHDLSVPQLTRASYSKVNMARKFLELLDLADSISKAYSTDEKPFDWSQEHDVIQKAIGDFMISEEEYIILATKLNPQEFHTEQSLCVGIDTTVPSTPKRKAAEIPTTPGSSNSRGSLSTLSPYYSQTNKEHNDKEQTDDDENTPRDSKRQKLGGASNTLVHLQRSAIALNVQDPAQKDGETDDVYHLRLLEALNTAQRDVDERARNTNQDDEAWVNIAKQPGKTWIKQSSMYILEQIQKK